MTNKFEGQVVFSTQRSDFEKGRSYANPKFFDGTIPGTVKSAIVVGEWPNLVKALQERKIPTQVVAMGEPLPGSVSDNVDAGGANADTIVDDNAVPIPAQYHQLPTPEVLKLAGELGLTVDKRNDALKAISELKKKREAAASGILDPNTV